MPSTFRHTAKRSYATFRNASAKKNGLSQAGAAAAVITTASLVYALPARTLQAEAKVEAPVLTNVDYSQHAQVSMSWQNPGCYVWGSNKKGVADPSSGDTYTKAATRITHFDGMALRDLKVSEDMGVAVLPSGDVCQWGHSFHGPPVKRKKGVPVLTMEPDVTLSGKDIKKVELGKDVIYCLSKKGEVYVLPYAKEAQQSGPKVTESRWMGLTSVESNISYRRIKSDLAKGDIVEDIAAGLDHVLMLTRTGEVYTASTNQLGNAGGQLGLSEWSCSSDGQCVQAYPVVGFKKSSKSIAIAAGDHHSVVLDEDGEVFTFGSNNHGQLAFEFNSSDTSDVSTPTMVSVTNLYPRNYAVRCLKIACGGKNTYMVVQHQQYGKLYPSIDIWAAGMGQFGQLGNNTWNHYQAKPVRVKVISGLTEWNEQENKVSPIGVHSLSVGRTHAVCCLDNYSKVDADASTGSSRSSFHDVNYGRDVFVWGGNDSWQIGGSGRSNRAVPGYIEPLEQNIAAVKSGWEDEGHKRFQLTPSKVIEVMIDGRKVKRNVEQAIVAGDRVTACYSRLVD